MTNQDILVLSLCLGTLLLVYRTVIYWEYPWRLKTRSYVSRGGVWTIMDSVRIIRPSDPFYELYRQSRKLAEENLAELECPKDILGKLVAGNQANKNGKQIAFGVDRLMDISSD
jgi:hypothetical protein